MLRVFPNGQYQYDADQFVSLMIMERQAWAWVPICSATYSRQALPLPLKLHMAIAGRSGAHLVSNGWRHSLSRCTGVSKAEERLVASLTEGQGTSGAEGHLAALRLLIVRLASSSMSYTHPWRAQRTYPRSLAKIIVIGATGLHPNLLESRIHVSGQRRDDVRAHDVVREREWAARLEGGGGRGKGPGRNDASGVKA